MEKPTGYPKAFVYPLLLFLAIAVLPACNPSKQNTNNIKKKSSSYLLKKLETNQIQFEWFGAKASVRYQDQYNRQSFSSTIRVRKDSIIWLNVKKMGIEGGRALITPDSIFIINRLQKEYYPRDFGYLKRKYNIDVDFHTLQQLIVGNAIYYDMGKAKSSVESPYYRLTTATSDLRNTYLLLPSNFLLQAMLLEDITQARTIKMDFGRYKQEGDKQLALERQIKLESPETGKVHVEMAYSKVEINIPKNTPFSVSPRYQVK